MMGQIDSIMANVASIGQQVREWRAQQNRPEFVEARGTWPTLQSLPPGWQELALGVDGMPNDEAIWNPWSQELPPQGPLLLLDRSTGKFVATSPSRTWSLHWSEFFTPIPPNTLAPDTNRTCWGSDPQNVVEVTVLQRRFYTRSDARTVQFIGVLTYRVATQRWECTSNSWIAPGHWVRQGSPTSTTETSRRLATIPG